VSPQQGLFQSIRVDNRLEFTSRILEQWTYLNGVELAHPRPGKPGDKAFIGDIQRETEAGVSQR